MDENYYEFTGDLDGPGEPWTNWDECQLELEARILDMLESRNSQIDMVDRFLKLVNEKLPKLF